MVQRNENFPPGRGSAYLQARIARDEPEINVSDFPSIKAAARAAGIIKPAISRLDKLRTAWRNASGKERATRRPSWIGSHDLRTMLRRLEIENPQAADLLNPASLRNLHRRVA